MTKNEALSTEETILAAAKDIFMRKGFAGTRMQEVADEAGINKAMLHYYFRSKEKLFKVILSEAIDAMAPVIMRSLSTEKGVLAKIEDLVTNHISLLLERPYMPLFVMHELSQNRGQFVSDMMERHNAQPLLMAFFQQVLEEVASGEIREINPLHLLMNTMSLTVFPFIMQPMITTAVGIPDEMFQEVLVQRKKEVIDFIHASLRP